MFVAEKTCSWNGEKPCSWIVFVGSVKGTKGRGRGGRKRRVRVPDWPAKRTRAKCMERRDRGWKNPAFVDQRRDALVAGEVPGS